MATAQSNKRTSAYMYNSNGLLDKAKEAIDEASKHEKTINDPKTWLYRGIIYYNIAVSQLPAYKELDPNAAMKSYEALLKSKELDVKGKYEKDITENLDKLAPIFFNMGGVNYNSEAFAEAIEDYKIAYKIAEENGRLDTLSAFNIGIAGVFAKNPEISIQYLEKCIEVDFVEPRIYIYYSQAMKQMNDTVRALEILKEGRERYPDEYSLILQEGQTYLETGQNEKLQQTMLEAIKNDSLNANLYATLGQTYDNAGDKEMAIKYYSKAIEVGSEDNRVMSNVHYNIGAIYNNKAANLNEQIAELDINEQEEYEKLHMELVEYLEMAIPYFEKALEFTPDDQNFIIALKGIYSQLNMNDKLKELMDE